MSVKLAPLSFEGGVNLKADPHLLKPNEWLKLQNMWPYKEKFIGTRPSLLHEMELLPVDNSFWNSWLFNNDPVLPVEPYPTNVKYYAQWFRHLTPLRTIFLGELNKLAMICVCNFGGKVKMYEKFENEDATTVTLDAGEVILMLLPNDLKTNPIDAGDDIFPMISGVRLGRTTNITPTLIEFNGTIIAANKGCAYVVKVVHSDTLPVPSVTTWPGIDYRFTKVDFGPSNLNFRADGAIVYRNRFVYWRGNKLWFSDPFQPELIYPNAVDAAYLGVFFNTGLTEDITALGVVYLSDKEQIAESKMAIWTQHGMLTFTGEPATTIASTPEEIWVPVTVSDINIPAGCVSGASIVKTKYGLVWCGAESVWFMQGDATPMEVGYKIGPRIAAQSFESAGRIFATFDDQCYRLVINEPGVGFNPYDALNEMWCLSFMGDIPNKDNAAWFGPQVFTNIDNPENETLIAGGPAGLYCCAKLLNINDDKTWYIQPFTYALGESLFGEDVNGTRLGLSSITHNLGVDITAPYQPVTPVVAGYNYGVGSIFHIAGSVIDDGSSYAKEYMVVIGGVLLVDLMSIVILIGTSADNTRHLFNKRILTIFTEEQSRFPQPFKVSLQSGNLTFDNAELEKLIDGYELTFKTLNPIVVKTWWAPWQPTTVAANNVTLVSKSKLASTAQNQLDHMFNEPVLTSRLVSAPPNKRFNGLEAQLNIEDSDYVIVAADNVTDPEWNLIRFVDGGANTVELNLFDFDSKGVAKYESMFELIALLQAKLLLLGYTLQYTLSLERGVEFKLQGEAMYIDLTAQGWEWFGFIPNGIDLGDGVDIVSNAADDTLYIKANGPSPLYTPRLINFVKINVRYDVFEARPR